MSTDLNPSRLLDDIHNTTDPDPSLDLLKGFLKNEEFTKAMVASTDFLTNLANLLHTNIKDKSKLRLLSKYMSLIALIAHEEKHKSRVATVENGLIVDSLVIFVYDAVKIPERKQAVRILSYIADSVWTRDSIPQSLNKLYTDPTLVSYWIRKIQALPFDSEEQDMWVEMLQNTDLKIDQYKPGKHWYSADDFPFLKVLEENFDVIKREAEALRDHQEKLVPWPEKFITKTGWDVLGLYAFENKLDKLCAICPETTRLLETIPGLQTALFSCLRPRAHIKPHIGYYMYSEKILRVHLGVVVPTGCTIKINGEEHTWEEGKLIVFDDTFRHEAWNPSYDTTRVVLMFDILTDIPPESRNPEFWEKAQRQKGLGQDSLISNDLLQAIGSVMEDPAAIKNVKERPKQYL
eukprot:TRINITY_DN9462_c0_g1_i1.p1 TRINITY_DN9462_c0_g1~~TRINITY_DN9462_c0_g1_i1.p1  ORF type:complete len:406 (-),score=55.37 TRINITY_DN9462_c0_g1_i1:13-1230(-)